MDLGMKKGKIAAQVGHAGKNLFINIEKIKNFKNI